MVNPAEEVERLVKRHDIRTADQADLKSLLRKLRAGDSLSYQERVRLWAYLSRYRRENDDRG